MMDFLVAEFVTGFLIFLRMASCLFTAPVFNSRAVPVMAKMLLALVLTYIVFFTVSTFPFNYNEQGLFVLMFYGIKEILVGMILGFALNIIFYGVSLAGQILAFDMGIVMAQVFDPTTESHGNVLGTLLNLAALLIFILINGHHYLIESLVYSYKIVGLGGFAIDEAFGTLIIQYTASVFIVAVKIAAPIIASFFLLHLAAGIMGRMMPQMQVFFVILPLKQGLGFVLLAAISPLIVYLLKNLLLNFEEALLELLKAMGY